jgi:tRNA(Ile)-lysidine synthase
VGLCPYPEIAGETKIDIPGVTLLAGWRIESSVVDKLGHLDLDSGDEFAAFLDMDKTGKSLFVRSRIDGDHFQPLGFDQPKRLNRFMIDLKIPQAWRERVPLVCCPGQGLPTSGQIVWVVGYRIDDRFKVTDDTERVLKIEFKRA